MNNPKTPTSNRHKIERIRAHTTSKFRRSLRIFLMIAVIILGIVIFDAVRDQANIFLVAAGLIAGTIIGVISSRMYKLSWDTDGQHVTNQIDKFGALILVLFIAFELFRNNIVSTFIEGSTSVPAVSMALLAGALYGRVLGSGRKIIQILKQQEVFHIKHNDNKNDNQIIDLVK